MAFHIAQAGGSFHILDADGELYTTLTLPTGVTVDPNIRAQFHTIANKLVITRAPSVNLWVDPADFTVRPLAVLPPVAPPVIAAGSGTGLTGTYYASYSYIVVVDGIVVQESPRSPLSLPVTLANDDVDWSNLVPSTEAHVNGYRLYRTAADGSASVMFEVQQLGGNTQIAYTGDATTDQESSFLPAPRTGNAPGGTIPGTRLQVACVWRDRLFAVSDDPSQRDIVAYTESGDPFTWYVSNRIIATAKGEDEWGVTGFLPRRDELVVCKRSRFLKILGDSNDNFEMIVLAEGVSCAAADSCIVVDDVGYCRGITAIYAVGSAGVVDLTTGKIGAWMHGGTVFNLDDAQIQRTMASYNPVTDCLEFHMVTGETVDRDEFTVWAAYSRRLQEWVGPCATAACEPTCRGTMRDASGQLQPIIGGGDGRLYLMNRPEAYDIVGSTSAIVGINLDWLSKAYAGIDPDGFHNFGRITILQRAQGDGAAADPSDWVTVYVFVGPIHELTQSVVSPQATFRFDLSKSRVVLPRPGSGQAIQLRFRHNAVTDPDTGGITGAGTSPYDVELWGLEIPVARIGRR